MSVAGPDANIGARARQKYLKRHDHFTPKCYFCNFKPSKKHIALAHTTTRAAQKNVGIKNMMEKMVTAAWLPSLPMLSPKMKKNILEVADAAPTKAKKQTDLTKKTADKAATLALILRNVALRKNKEITTTSKMENRNEENKKTSGQKMTLSSGACAASGLTVVPNINSFKFSRSTPASSTTNQRFNHFQQRLHGHWVPSSRRYGQRLTGGLEFMPSSQRNTASTPEG